MTIREQGELVKQYDGAILKIAKKVAGQREDLVDDLLQIGRLTLLDLYPKNQRWAFLSRVIKNKILDEKTRISGVTGCSPRSVGRGVRIISEEIPETLQSIDRDTSDLPEITSILELIEHDIQTLPIRERRLAQAWLRHLEGYRCRISSEAGRIEAQEIVARLVARYRDRYERLTS